MRPARSRAAHVLFLAAMTLKAVDGALELAAGAVLALESRTALVSWLRRATAPELREDPTDLIATHLRLWGPGLLRHGQKLAAAYFLVQGAVKLALVVAVLRGILRAFPWAITLMAALAVYLGCEAAARRSLTVGIAALLDAAAALLVAVEYSARRTG